MEIREPTYRRFKRDIYEGNPFPPFWAPISWFIIALIRPYMSRSRQDDVYFTKIASGSLHSIGLTEDNNIKTWGNNQYGQMGNGYTQESVGCYDTYIAEKTEKEQVSSVKAKHFIMGFTPLLAFIYLYKTLFPLMIFGIISGCFLIRFGQARVKSNKEQYSN